MAKFELGGRFAMPLLIKLASESDSSADKAEKATKPSSTDKAVDSGKKDKDWISRVYPYASELTGFIPAVAYSAAFDRDDPARLIGSLAGAGGGYLMNKLIGSKIMNAINPDINKSKDEELKRSLYRYFGGLNIGAMSGLGRLIGASVAGKRPVNASDLAYLTFVPASTAGMQYFF